MKKSLLLFSTLAIFVVTAQFCIGFVLLVNADGDDDWPMFGRDSARTGGTAVDSVDESLLGWDVGWTRSRLDSPAVAYGYVYIKLDHVVCYDALTGDTVWESDKDASMDVWSVAVADGYVYANSESSVYALDAYTGDEVWEFEVQAEATEEDDDINAEFFAPAVANGVVYIGCGDYNLYALDAYSGNKLWNYSTDAKMRCCPAVSEGIVYVSSNDGNVYAFDAVNGTKLWSYTTGRRVQYPYESSPAVADGVVYVGSINRTVYALDALSGSKLWSYPVGGIYSTPAVAYGNVYVADQDTLYALDASTGIKVWDFRHPSFAPEYSSPTVVDGVVYLGSSGGDSYSGRLYALDAYTGGKIEEVEFDAKIFSTPAVAYGMVYVATSTRLYAMNSSDFEPTLPLTLIAVVAVVAVIVLALGLYVYRRHK